MSSIFTATNADGYELMMGRWSRLLAESFLDFADLPDGATAVLDVGCGTGSLTRSVAARTKAEAVGIDTAAPFVDYARASNRNPRISYAVQDATALSFASASFDAAVSMLVLNFIPEYRRAASEMIRVTRAGGRIAAACWGVAGGVVTFRMFWDTAAALDPAASSNRADALSAPLTRHGELASLFRELGLREVEETDLTIWMRFQDFADFWTPYTSGQATTGAYVAGLDQPKRERFRAALHDAYCGGREDGPRAFAAIAHAAKGRVP
ncbi:MAG TPA: class I SAM-dependent methyltransferase [Microvirga sp.]|nr:class I SAM-dependent methyltransferase [Microvirga sp.]